MFHGSCTINSHYDHLERDYGNCNYFLFKRYFGIELYMSWNRICFQLYMFESNGHIQFDEKLIVNHGNGLKLPETRRGKNLTGLCGASTFPRK